MPKAFSESVGAVVDQGKPRGRQPPPVFCTMGDDVPEVDDRKV